MTDPVITIETPHLSVEPGGQVQTMVTLRNPADIVEGYQLEVLGEGVADWATVMPPEVQVYPGQESTAVVVISPPADAAAGSGAFPFAVRAQSVVDADTAAVAEGDLDIGKVFGLQAKLTPVTSSGRWHGQHLLELSNWGNAPVRLKVTASDPDEKLAFLVAPDFVDVPIGVAGRAAIRVKTRKPFVRGQPARLPFQILAEPDPPEDVPVGPGGPLPVMADPRRAAVDGTFLQKPILSKFVVVAAALVTAGLVAAIVFAVRSGPKAPAATALGTGVPRTPALSLTVRDATSIDLAWEAQPNLDGYKLYRMTAEGRTSGVEDVDGALDFLSVADLLPQTEYCFRLQAVRGEQASLISESQCAHTVAAQVTASSAPAVTTIVSPPSSGPVAPTEPSALPSAPGQPTALPTAPGQPTTAPGQPTAPPTVAPTAPPTPAPTAPPTVAPTAAPTVMPTLAPTLSPTLASTVPPTGISGPPGVFGPTDTIAVLAQVPLTDPNHDQVAAGLLQNLASKGIAASALRTADHPALRLFGQPTIASLVIYAGPFTDQATAQQFCTGNAANLHQCILTRPNPG